MPRILLPIVTREVYDKHYSLHHIKSHRSGIQIPGMVHCLFSLCFFLSVAGLVSSIRLSSESNILSENLLEIAKHPCSSNITKCCPKAAQSGPVECNDRKVKAVMFYYHTFNIWFSELLSSCRLMCQRALERPTDSPLPVVCLLLIAKNKWMIAFRVSLMSLSREHQKMKL